MNWTKRIFYWIGRYVITKYKLLYHNDCSTHARCPWCGYWGRINSQGNLFCCHTNPEEKS